MENSPRLSLPYLAPAQAQKHVTVNEGLRRLDALVQLTVSSRSIAAEPAAPAEGEAYIVPAGASGAAWAAFAADDVAVFQDGAWARIAPAPGFRAFAADEAALLVFGAAGWATVSGGAAASAPQFGVNAAADNTNRLTVKSDAALFSHDDATPGTGDIRIVLNKSAAAKTASHLFQTGFSGRAEFGLTGDDDFHIKVSADGAAWNEAIFVDKDNGYVGFNTTAPAANVELNVDGVATDGSLISGDHFLLTAGPSGASFAGIVAFNTNAFGRMVFKGTRARGTPDAPAIVQDGDFVLSFLSAIYDGATKRATAALEFVAEGAQAAGVAPQAIKFLTGTTNARTARGRVAPDGGLVWGSPTGDTKGAGTINAQAVYDDNTLLTCYVFDQALDGHIVPAKWDAKVPDRKILERDPDTGDVLRDEVVPRRHEPMRKFVARAGGPHDPLTLDGYAAHWKEKRHLTSMPNEAAFDPAAGMPAGEWIQRLVETVEIQAVLIEELNRRLKALEAA